ncbi:TPA: hypothetical protein HA219_00210 [Candidatus Woesearchaeota archaeon]|nr:hypothetical protein [Candidatus Woesearchaeota archaeon]HIH39138.1 hypothetical protein [Candidatus Woesearchaeota archaeon]
MEMISRISRGTKMDQIYISKDRHPDFEVGSYVAIAPVSRKKRINLFYCRIKQIEPIKSLIVREIFEFLSDAENVIITGSFLERGFEFNDIDLIVIDGTKKPIEKFISEKFGLEPHIISTTYESLRKGMNADPLFQMLLNKFISKKRIIFKMMPKINYKLLDINLLNSRLLIDNFDYLNGKEKYKMIRNIFAIKNFLEKKAITNENIDDDINAYFGKNTVDDSINNMLQKNKFIKKYKKLYNDIFNKIMRGIEQNAE